jgi:hypothetical protein
LFAIDGLEEIERHLGAVFSDGRLLRQGVDLCVLGQRVAVGTEDIGRVVDGELVRLVVGAELELAADVGDHGMQ